MARVASRRISLLDVMILVAVTAVGLALLRFRISFADLPAFFATLTTRPPGGRSVGGTLLLASGLLELAIPCVLPWTLGLIAIRLIPPRPRLRRLVLQPGFIACVAFLGVGLLAYLIAVATLGIRGKLNPPRAGTLVGYHGGATLLGVQQGGWAVAVAWLILALSGHWRPEPSWLDRLGRTFGCFWLAAALLVTDLFNAMVLL